METDREASKCFVPLNIYKTHRGYPTVHRLPALIEDDRKMNVNYLNDDVEAFSDNEREADVVIEKGLVYDSVSDVFKTSSNHKGVIELVENAKTIVIPIAGANFKISSKTMADVAMVHGGVKPGYLSTQLLQMLLYILSNDFIEMCSLNKLKKGGVKRKREEGEEEEEEKEGEEEDEDLDATNLRDMTLEEKLKARCSGLLHSGSFTYTTESGEELEGITRFAVDVDLCYSHDEKENGFFKRQKLPLCYAYYIHIYDPRIDLNKGIRNFITSSRTRSGKVPRKNKDLTEKFHSSAQEAALKLANANILDVEVTPESYLEMLENTMGLDDFIDSFRGSYSVAGDESTWAFNLISKPKAGSSPYIDIYECLDPESRFGDDAINPFRFSSVYTNQTDLRNYLVNNMKIYPKNLWISEEEQVQIDEHFRASCLCVARKEIRYQEDGMMLDDLDELVQETNTLMVYLHPFRVFRLPRLTMHPKVIVNSFMLHIQPVYMNEFYGKGHDFRWIKRQDYITIKKAITKCKETFIESMSHEDLNKSDIELTRDFIFPETSSQTNLVDSKTLAETYQERSLIETRALAGESFFGTISDPGCGLPSGLAAIYTRLNRKKFDATFTIFPDFRTDKRFKMKIYDGFSPLSTFIIYMFTELYEKGAARVSFLHKEIFHTFLNAMYIYRGDLYQLQPLYFALGESNQGKSFIKDVMSTYLINNSFQRQNSATNRAYENGGLLNDMAIVFSDDSNLNSGYFAESETAGDILGTLNSLHSEGIVTRMRTVANENGIMSTKGPPTFNRMFMFIAANHLKLNTTIRTRSVVELVPQYERAYGNVKDKTDDAENDGTNTVLSDIYKSFQTFSAIVGNMIRVMALPYAKLNQSTLNFVLNKMNSIFDKYYGHTFSDQRLTRKVEITAYSVMLMRIWVSICFGLVEGIDPGRCFNEMVLMEIIPKLLVFTEEDVLQAISLNESEFKFFTEYDLVHFIAEKTDYQIVEFDKKTNRAAVPPESDKLFVENRSAFYLDGNSIQYNYDYINVTKALEMKVPSKQEALPDMLRKTLNGMINCTNEESFDKMFTKLKNKRVSINHVERFRGEDRAVYLERDVKHKKKVRVLTGKMMKNVNQADNVGGGGNHAYDRFQLLFCRERFEELLKYRGLESNDDVLINGFKPSRLNLILQKMGYEQSNDQNIALAGFPLRNYDSTSWSTSKFEALGEPQVVPYILNTINYKEKFPLDPKKKQIKSFKAGIEERARALGEESVIGFDYDNFISHEVLKVLGTYDYENEQVDEWVETQFDLYSPLVLQRKFKEYVDEKGKLPSYPVSEIDSYISECVN